MARFEQFGSRVCIVSIFFSLLTYIQNKVQVLPISHICAKAVNGKSKRLLVNKLLINIHESLFLFTCLKYNLLVKLQTYFHKTFKHYNHVLTST